jgi:hypothetical protein
MQLGYLGQELQSGYSGVLAAMRSATDPAAAAGLWDTNFEGSSGAAHGARMSNAQTIYQQIQTGKLTATSAAGIPAATATATAPKSGGDPGPFTPDSIKIPLTATQRSAAIAYIKKHRGSLSGLDKISTADDKLTSDLGIVLAYRIVWNDQAGPATPKDIIGGVLGPVATVAIKSVFTLGGLGMVLIGSNAAARSQRSEPQNVEPAPA